LVVAFADPDVTATLRGEKGGAIHNLWPKLWLTVVADVT
jgi:hypothetical protein